MKTRNTFWLFLLSFIFVTLFSRATSFLYVFEGADPSVFKQMGLAVLKGKTLYIDYFDNKGCLLYFIHAFGLWLGGNFIILLMQTLSLTVTLAIWNKMLALYQNRRQRIFCLSIALFLLACFYGAGDQTQEWCLPFISYPLLVFTRAYKDKLDVRPGQMLLIGLCFGIITFIQVNNAVAFLGFVACLWLQYLLHKDFGKLFRSLGCFLAGWLMIAIPCVLYFYLKAGWLGVSEMFYASFLSNLEYIGTQYNTQWFHWIPYALFLLALLLLNIINLQKQRLLWAPVFIAWLLFVGTFGRLCNNFYLIALLPLCVLSMAFLKFDRTKIMKLTFTVVIVGCAAFMGSIGFFHVISDLVLQKEKEVAIYEDFHQCVAAIPENEHDSIYNYNLGWHGTSMMEHEGMLQCNRVLFNYLVFNLPTLREEETSKPFSKPKWILISPDFPVYTSDAQFVLEHYELVCQFHYDRLYWKRPRVGHEFEVCLYHRKE